MRMIAALAWPVWLMPLSVLHAQDAVVVTIGEALEIADGQNPELASARERAGAQEAHADAAGRAAWPRLALDAEAFRTDNPARVFAGRLNRGAFGPDDFAIDRLNDPDPLSHLATVAVFELPIDVFGKASSRAAGERATARELGARVQEVRQDVRLRVVEAYERARLALKAVTVGERALEAARAREEDVAAHVAQGAALAADQLRARARRRQREADLAGAREQLEVSRAVLARVLGAPGGTVYRPSDVPAAIAPLEATLAGWQERAAAGRALLVAAREHCAGAHMGLQVERRSVWPDLEAYAQLEDDRGGSASARSYVVGASLRWDLFDPARGRRAAAAQAQWRATESDARAAADQVRLDVETAWRRATGARERHAAAAGGAEEGREALRVVQERRRSGLATLTDELETETAALAAELDELRAAMDVALADATLKRAAGAL
jgi:outer membrane protein TolC